MEIRLEKCFKSHPEKLISDTNKILPLPSLVIKTRSLTVSENLKIKFRFLRLFKKN